MALIGKIREKSWLLLIVIGGAMVAFVVGDLFTGGGGMQEDHIGIGTVDGQKVDEDTYDIYLNNARQGLFQEKMRQNPNQQPQFTQQDEEAATKQAWDAIISESILNKEYQKLGLLVDDYELDNVLYGENGYPPSSLSVQFIDSVTGEFAPDQLREALDQLHNSDDPQNVQQYRDVLSSIRQMRLEQKYMILLGTGVHTTSLEAKRKYENEKTVKNVAYVYQNLSNVPNDVVDEPSIEEVRAYYDKHKNDAKYKQKASRRVSFFKIPILPNKSDTLNAMEMLKKIALRFEKSKDDSSFVMRYSELKNFTSDSTATASLEGPSVNGVTYPASVAKEMDNAKKGDVIGPYVSRKGATVSKVIGFHAEELATVRHILLKAETPEQMAEAHEKANELMKEIREKDNFNELVLQYSEDQGSVNNEGKYVDFRRGMMVQPFEDFSFDKPVGSLGAVETSYGVHIVEVLENGMKNKPILAEVVKEIKPTKGTVDEANSLTSNYIYELFDQMEGKSLTEKINVFNAYASELGLSVNTSTLRDENPSVSGFSDIAQGRILKLAYSADSKEGELSSSPIHDNNNMVVAFLAGISKEGEPRFEVVERQMAADLMKERKAEYIMDQMIGNEDLEGLAREMGAEFKSEGLTFATTNTAVGQEPKLIGTAFSGLKDGEMSIPVMGKNGVFVLQVESTTEANETDDYSAEIQQLQAQKQNDIMNRFREGLIKSANVIDNRTLRRFGVN